VGAQAVVAGANGNFVADVRLVAHLRDRFGLSPIHIYLVLEKPALAPIMTWIAGNAWDEARIMSSATGFIARRAKWRLGYERQARRGNQ
jgi:hypothetical protein